MDNEQNESTMIMATDEVRWRCGGNASGGGSDRRADPAPGDFQLPLSEGELEVIRWRMAEYEARAEEWWKGYRLLAEDIRADIESGDLRPPLSEGQLEEFYEEERSLVREALRHLETAGVLDVQYVVRDRPCGTDETRQS